MLLVLVRVRVQLLSVLHQAVMVRMNTAWTRVHGKVVVILQVWQVLHTAFKLEMLPTLRVLLF